MESIALWNGQMCSQQPTTQAACAANLCPLLY